MTLETRRLEVMGLKIKRISKINIHPDPIKIQIKTWHKKTAKKWFKTYPKILQYTAIKTTRF